MITLEGLHEGDYTPYEIWREIIKFKQENEKLKQQNKEMYKWITALINKISEAQLSIDGLHRVVISPILVRDIKTLIKEYESEVDG